MISQRIKELRAWNHISQKELSVKLFVTPQAISKWERDESSPNPEAIAKMAEIFNVTADYLLGRTEQKEKPTPEEGGGLSETEQQIMKCVGQMSERQRETFLAYLQATQGRD